MHLEASSSVSTTPLSHELYHTNTQLMFYKTKKVFMG